MICGNVDYLISPTGPFKTLQGGMINRQRSCFVTTQVTIISLKWDYCYGCGSIVVVCLVVRF